jgi:predicted Fe-Mo cluster-binding NifX family protein
MGDGAVNVINAQNIKVIRGCVGDVRQVVEAYLAGRIADSGETCSEHGEGHVCNH